MTDGEAERVAKGLTKAGRFFLNMLAELPDGHWRNGTYLAGERLALRGLARRGLVDWNDHVGFRMCSGRRLNALGQRVRHNLGAMGRGETT